MGHRKQGLNASTTRYTALPQVTNSQAAAHESWLVRRSPGTPGFSREQSTSIPLILQETAHATCTQPLDPPPPSFLHAIHT